MIVEQLYTNCLAQAAYYIESNGEAAVIDPLRDYSIYLEKANTNGAKIKYIFETHFHADFVSGHIDLAAQTGATIVYGPETTTHFPVHVAREGEEFTLGNLRIRVLHTPGHTPESTCFLLLKDNAAPYCVFTGDTLFVGDVGRPDLLDGILTKEELASRMFHSLKKLTALPDEVIVYPAHGPGSACGKNIGKETQSTIGAQKQSNYALQPMTEDDFIKAVTEGITPAPDYFFKDARLNREGYASYDKVVEEGMKAVSVLQFKQIMAEHKALVIDSRAADYFELGFVPGSLNFGLNGQYAIWAATLLDLKQPLLLICQPGTELESIQRLTRVGFDHILGYLEGGFDAWRVAGEKIDMVISISSEEFALDAKLNPKAMILDVRKPTEYDSGHVLNAENIPLSEIPNRLNELDSQSEILIHCAGGYRSMTASSLLKRNGFNNVKNVWGGYGRIKEEKIDLVGAI